MSGDIEATLAALSNAEVKYLVVGGVAVVMTDEPPKGTFDVGYEGHQRRQVRVGLLTPAQRLEWLERKLSEVRRLLGTARPDSEPRAANSPFGTSTRIKTGTE